jgi:glycerophosphoryl diester phosphodiesterase
MHSLARLTAPVTIAHRAGNAIEDVRKATAAGVDVVEADLWLHRGRLEVRHSKTLGPFPVRWDRWWIDFAPGPCLDLHMLLETLGPGTTVMLDLKGRNRDLPRRLLQTYRAARPGQGILVCSQTWSFLDALEDEPDVDTVCSIGNRRQLRRAWPMLEQQRYDAVSIHSRLLTRDTVHRLRQHVDSIITWPINDRARFNRVRDLGITGVISDSLPLLHEIEREKAGLSRQPEPESIT